MEWSLKERREQQTDTNVSPLGDEKPLLPVLQSRTFLFILFHFREEI